MIGPAAESSRLYRFFARGFVAVSLVDGRLRLEGQGRQRAELSINRIEGIAVRRSFLWARLTVHTSDDTQRSIGGLDRQAAARLRDSVLDAAGQNAREFGPHLEELGIRIDGSPAPWALPETFRVHNGSRGPVGGGPAVWQAGEGSA